MHICFLDIDGTLVLTGKAGQDAFYETLADDFGIRQINGNVLFAGRSDRAIATDLFAMHDIEPTDDNWQRFCVGYIGRLETLLPMREGFVLPGVVELLGLLAERGDVALGLLTGNVREAAHRKLGHYELWDWFAFGGFGDDHVDRCDIAAAALADARLHLDGQHVEGELLVIGDTPNDISCGRSIGARCIAVPTGVTTADELRAAEPDVLVETLADVEPILALLDAAS